MKKLKDEGIGIGDFAQSLMESGQVSRKNSPPKVAPSAELPVTDVDVSDVDIPESMFEQVLHESFGIGDKAPKRVTVKEPLLTEQELLQEKIISLKEELVETINKLTSLVSEMAGMGMTTTQSIGVNVAGKYRGRNKRTRTIKRRKK